MSNELVAQFVQLAVGLVVLALKTPPLGAGLLALWFFARGAARRLGVKPGVGGDVLLPLALLVWLWRNRRDVREMMFCAAVVGSFTLLGWAVIKSPMFTARTFVAVGFAATVTIGVWGFHYLGGANPTLANIRAARAQRLREWDAQRSVAALTDEAVRVEDVRGEGDAVVAKVTVAAGQSPADFEALLLDKLAASVHALTGREAVSVHVSKTRTPGVFTVRVDTGHPLRKEVLWRDL